MKRKKQIHPSPSLITLEVLEDYKEKPSDSLEIRAMELIAGNHNLSSRYIELRTKQEIFLSQIKELQTSLDEVNKEMKAIERTIENTRIGESENLSDAIASATRVLGKISNELETTKKYGIKKATLDDMDAIAKHYHVPLAKLLERLDDGLMKKTLKNYDKMA